MESDDEMYEQEGNSYDFGARMYDSRIGRFNSTDPYKSNFPELSSYSFAANMPILCIDKGGLYPYPVTVEINGRRYRVTLDTEDAQSIKIRSGFLGLRRTNFSLRSDATGDVSLSLLKQSHSKAMPTRHQDITKLRESTHDGIKIITFIERIISENQELNFVVVENHDVPTKQERLADLYDFEKKHLFTYCENEGPQCIYATEDEREIGRGELTGEDLETQWTKDRADYAVSQFFSNTRHIDTYSRNNLESNSFPGIRLKPFGQDAVGITMFFDFNNIPAQPDEYEQDNDRPSGGGKHPRFL